MRLDKVGAGFLATLIFGISGRASADFLEEFARTRLFAQETLKITRAETSWKTPAAEEKKKLTQDRLRTASYQKKMSVSEIDRLIEEKASRYSINPEFIRAVVRVESGYNATARSPKGAMGLMQLMPATASELRVENPWDPGENLNGGISYLAGLLWEFRDVRDALAAYNAGPKVVRQGLTIPEETRQYVQLVLGHFKRSSGRR